MNSCDLCGDKCGIQEELWLPYRGFNVVVYGDSGYKGVYVCRTCLKGAVAEHGKRIALDGAGQAGASSPADEYNVIETILNEVGQRGDGGSRAYKLILASAYELYKMAVKNADRSQ